MFGSSKIFIFNRTNILKNLINFKRYFAVLKVSKTLKSKLDPSVNWVFQDGKGNYEARCVWRKVLDKNKKEKPKLAIYVSSHSGCNQGCKFCYLTQLNQTWFKHCSIENYQKQVSTVLDHYDKIVNEYPNSKALRANVNFMARGEPLANKNVINSYQDVYNTIQDRGQQSNFNTLKMNISTIMPHTIRHRKLSDIFGHTNTEIFYSMYSINDKFKKEWMPNAIHYSEALSKLKEWQEFSNQPITIHGTFIEGYNDNIDEVKQMADVIKSYDLFGKINIVRFNPPPGLEYIKESSESMLNMFLNILSSSLRESSSKSKIVPKVGEDVYTSCGMFVTD